MNIVTETKAEEAMLNVAAEGARNGPMDEPIVALVGLSPLASAPQPCCVPIS